MSDNSNTDSEYINSVDYKALEPKIKELSSVLDDLTVISADSRKLRYAEVDVKAEITAGSLQPDELYIPQHIIDTNIRREQSPYVQYITQSPRAVICEDELDPSVDLAPLEKDLTKKLRFPGWQLAAYANIDSFQANGYGVMETVQDLNNPGHIGRESVQFGDFAFLSDTRDLQAVEILARQYYFTKTKLKSLCGDPLVPSPDDWAKEQVDRVIANAPDPAVTLNVNIGKDASLYRVMKVMKRVGGVVHVAWCCPSKCDGYLRAFRPLFLGRRKLSPPTMVDRIKGALVPGALPPSEEAYETEYPYFLYPYLISENDTISQLKGRVFLDQDAQEAASSLLSSLVTKARRSAGMYFSRDTSDPNSDILEQKNIFFRSGCIINSKVQAFELKGPDPALFNAVSSIISGNQNETSQVNFAETNRQNDSRKTATAVQASMQMAQQLSTVQVVLYSIANKQQFTYEVEIIKSRILAGLIKVLPPLMPLYQRQFSVKPSGDTDVIEKQQLIQVMMQMWPIISQTPAAPVFLSDLIELLFPDRSSKYLAVLQQALAQAQSQQGQQQQMMMQKVMEMAQGVVALSKKPEMFSETGKLHALPVLEQAAQQIEQALSQQGQQGTK